MPQLAGQNTIKCIAASHSPGNKCVQISCPSMQMFLDILVVGCVGVVVAAAVVVSAKRK